MAQSKLNFLVKELAAELQLKECSGDNVETIIKNLFCSNPEFKRIPKHKFKEMVEKEMMIVLKAESNSEISNSSLVAVTPKKSGEEVQQRLTSGVKRKRVSTPKDKSEYIPPPDVELPSSSLGEAPRPTARLSDLAGLDKTIETIKELIFYPVQLPSLYKHLGIQPPSGLLLHGPSGCGKTTMAMAIGGELELPFFKVSGPELIGGTSGESETRIRELFDNAMRSAPSVLFIDAIDVIAGKRESSQRGMDRRVVAQLFDCIDELKSLGKPPDTKFDRELQHSNMDIDETQSNGESESEKKNANDENLGHVIFMAATDKPDALDPGVRGRFSKELPLPVPDAPARSSILKLATRQMNLDDSVDFDVLGKSTPGFVGADLHALCRETGVIAVRRIVSSLKGDSLDCPLSELVSQHFQALKMDENSTFKVAMSDFMEAAKSIQPSAKREGFAVVPDVTWNDVGALASVREELLHNVIEPISHPERFIRLGLEVPAGVLFFGPPGCGKTLLAKALSNQSGANFISVKGPELLNMYVGESESRVRQVFSRARASAPCVIFFDELDALCPRRGMGRDGGSGVSERVVNQLLTELDGLESRKDVYIIAATNRLELIDDAMLRPGRLGKLLYVPLPSPDDRGSILRAVSRKLSVSPDVNFDDIGSDSKAEGFSGADLAALVREAGMAVMQDWRKRRSQNESSSDEDFNISKAHFDAAFDKVRASVSAEDRRRYERVHELISVGGFGAIEALRMAREEFE